MIIRSVCSELHINTLDVTRIKGGIVRYHIRSSKVRQRVWMIVSMRVEQEDITTWVSNSKEHVGVLIPMRTYENMVRLIIA